MVNILFVFRIANFISESAIYSRIFCDVMMIKIIWHNLNSDKQTPTLTLMIFTNSMWTVSCRQHWFSFLWKFFCPRTPDNSVRHQSMACGQRREWEMQWEAFEQLISVCDVCFWVLWPGCSISISIPMKTN